MDKISFYTIGLMSGTSLDGLDIVYSYFLNKDDFWLYEIIHSKTITYNDKIKQQLQNAHLLSGYDLLMLHNHYGEYIGKQVLKFIEEKKIQNVDFIASHGHTVFHSPEKKLNFQIGNPYFILLETGIPVIADFRSRNIVFGGQGAPLVPIGDRLLFGNYEIRINLGGFSNYSLEDENNNTIAGDICPVNIILNLLSEKFYNKEMDIDGELGKKGEIIENLLEELNSLKFYNEMHNNKTLSREWLETEFMPVLKKYFDYNPEDLLRTIYEHIVIRISKIVSKYKNKKSILLTGGGAKNKFLTSLIKKKLNKHNIEIPNQSIIDYKEALIFAFLGVLYLCSQNNCLSSYTKATSDMICGNLYK